MTDHKMIPLIVAAIETHGPMTCEQLAQYVPLSVNAIYRNCKLAVETKLLLLRRVKNGKSTGRRLLKFYSNQNQLNKRAKAELARLERARIESEKRQLERARLTNFVPFRDPLVEAFYGKYARAA